MTKTEIIDDLVNYYSVDIRRRNAPDDNHLPTLIHEGKKNVLGLYVVASKFTEFTGKKLEDIPAMGGVLRFAQMLDSDVFLARDTYEDKLKKASILINIVLDERVQGHSIQFWEEMTALHDASTFWDTDSIGMSDGLKLSMAGRQAVANLKEAYKDDTIGGSETTIHE